MCFDNPLTVCLRAIAVALLLLTFVNLFIFVAFVEVFLTVRLCVGIPPPMFVAITELVVRSPDLSPPLIVYWANSGFSLFSPLSLLESFRRYVVFSVWFTTRRRRATREVCFTH